MTGVLPCHWKQVGACLAEEGQGQHYGHTIQQGTDVFSWLLPLDVGLQRLARVYF